MKVITIVLLMITPNGGYITLILILILMMRHSRRQKKESMKINEQYDLYRTKIIEARKEKEKLDWMIESASETTLNKEYLYASKRNKKFLTGWITEQLNKRLKNS